MDGATESKKKTGRKLQTRLQPPDWATILCSRSLCLTEMKFFRSQSIQTNKEKMMLCSDINFFDFIIEI